MRSSGCRPLNASWTPLRAAAAILAVTACVDPAAPPTRGGPDQARPAAFAYPDQPPLVDRRSLGDLLTRLDADRTILWVVPEINDRTGTTAAALAASRDALGAAGVRVVGLYAGPSTRWQPAVVPMLRRADANFIFAVVAPPAASGVAAWLTGDSRALRPGLYVIDRSQRVAARFDDRPDNIAATIHQLTTRPAPPTQPAPVQPETLLVRVRLIDLATGQVTVRAVAEAADPTILAADLAQQLAAAVDPPALVAILPIREVGRGASPRSPGDHSLGHLIAKGLANRGWPQTILPEAATQALATLDLTAMQVEFEPSRLANQVPWEAILVGSAERRGQAPR